MTIGMWEIHQREANEELLRKCPTVGIYFHTSDKCDPNFVHDKINERPCALIRQRDQKYDKEIKYFYAIVAMALNEYDTSFNEEYEKITIEYSNGEISKEKFLEEVSYLKMAIKLENE